MKSKKAKNKKESPKKNDTLKIIGRFEDVVKKAVSNNPTPKKK